MPRIFRRPLFKTLCASAMAAALTGCAPYRIDKTAVPAPADVTTIGAEIARVRQFHQALYEVSTFAVDRCKRKAAREPFTLFTVGHLASQLPEEKIAAYYRAGDFDETWKVLWTGDGGLLPQGQRIVAINGNGIENNKTGMGEYPLVKYLHETSRARDAATEGKPFVVTLEGGRELAVPTRPACRTQVWAMPVYDASGYSEIPTALHGAVVLPPNAIRAARNLDEYRYLAGVAVYLSASSEANGKRWGANALLGASALAVVAMPILYPVLSMPTVTASGALVGGDMGLRSAVFATQVVADMGGDPRAGVELLGRLDAQKLEATRIQLPEQEREQLRQWAQQLARPRAEEGGATASTPAASTP